MRYLHHGDLDNVKVGLALKKVREFCGEWDRMR